MKKSTILMSSVTILCFLFFGGLGQALFYFFSPVSPVPATQSFIVTKGDTITSISQKLTDKGILRSPYSLKLLVKFSASNSVIQPGTYKLSPHMGPREILTALLSETQDVWVTFKEGLRAEEMAELLGEKLHDAFDPNVFIQLAKPVEGHLFPDTYLLSKDMTADAVFSKLTNEFEDKYQQAVTEVGAGKLSKKESIILASLVQREGKSDADMRTVAGILLNRIDAAMPLQVDATLQYARGFDAQKETWWAVPTPKDRETESVFNTYLHPGLPPAPICNPGLSALKAALHPTESEYTFYLHEPNGTPHYAKTYEEHKINIEKYLR